MPFRGTLKGRFRLRRPLLLSCWALCIVHLTGLMSVIWVQFFQTWFKRQILQQQLCGFQSFVNRCNNVQYVCAFIPCVHETYVSKHTIPIPWDAPINRLSCKQDRERDYVQFRHGMMVAKWWFCGDVMPVALSLPVATVIEKFRVTLYYIFKTRSVCGENIPACCKCFRK